MPTFRVARALPGGCHLCHLLIWQTDVLSTRKPTQAKRSVDEMMTITLPKVGRGSRAIPVKLAVHVEPAKVGVAGPAKVDNN